MINMEIEKLAEKAEEATRLLDAMSNPKRLMILCNLLKGECTVSALSARVDLGQSPLSQHLAKLRSLGFVKTRRAGQQIYYSLASDAVETVLTALYGIYCTPSDT
ncbi:ArsR/SmtB family transcription factor [Pelagibacterium limicola]|uniref:ArsR/SmtB family transcription factor n=1 Tax=Pelagibacterium limicola TaxID=2791022 RepID=UPI0018AF946F|nr:metalloregulator ArsR/SmtB family transcription factor [Pelagibacterium limicola]